MNTNKPDMYAVIIDEEAKAWFPDEQTAIRVGQSMATNLGGLLTVKPVWTNGSWTYGDTVFKRMYL